jgi:hypothetical protein
MVFSIQALRGRRLAVSQRSVLLGHVDQQLWERDGVAGQDRGDQQLLESGLDEENRRPVSFRTKSAVDVRNVRRVFYSILQEYHFIGFRKKLYTFFNRRFTEAKSSGNFETTNLFWCNVV